MVVDYKEILKKGWHPEKEGTTFKGQMKGLIGRGDSDTARRDHVARPITSLPDPKSFGPPPRRTGSPSVAPPPPLSRPASTSSATTPYRPPTSAQQPSPTEDEPPAPPKQYRIDTTGLSTSNLPPPPIRRDGTGNYAPPTTSSYKPAPPALPPRLPPRNISSPPALPTRSASPSANTNTDPVALNQGAISRLGAAGISVPGLGIGSKPTSSSEPVEAPALNSLQSSFSRLRTSESPATAAAPAQGTTIEQKRAALKTAAAFRQDPNSVSFVDARSAASTANNFRQRHGEQVVSGLSTAGSLYGKYGGQVGQRQEGGGNNGSVVGQAMSAAAVLGKKKPPPPPPPKNLPVFRGGSGAETPPPIPVATRPPV